MRILVIVSAMIFLWMGSWSTEAAQSAYRISYATTVPGGSTPLSHPTGSTGWCEGYSAQLGFEIGAHALRATAATNALDHGVIARFVQNRTLSRKPSEIRGFQKRPFAHGGSRRTVSLGIPLSEPSSKT